MKILEVACFVMENYTRFGGIRRSAMHGMYIRVDESVHGSGLRCKEVRNAMCNGKLQYNTGEP